jgi:hypothetical protein
MDDISLLLRTPLEPSYELVPAQSLPREYVEESEPGKWAYRGNVDPAQLTLAVVTGGLSAIFLGPDLGREAEWVPASPAEKAAWKKLAPSRRKAFEREEAARLAEGRKVVEAVLARNQARKTTYERELAAQEAVRVALMALVQAEACSGDAFKFRLEAGHRCVMFATTRDRGPPVLQPADGKAVLRLRGQLALGADSCNWHFKEELPAGRDETIGPMSARVFAKGPRRLEPVRSHWPE